MGVHKLWEILEGAKEIIPLELLVGKRLCIDLSYWIVQLSKVNGGNVKDKPHLRGLFHRIRALLALNCHIVFVTDGAIPAVKAKVYYQRLAASTRSHNSRAILHGDRALAGPLKRNKGSDFGRMIEEAKALAAAFGFPCLVSLEEGEAQCASLNAMGFCDACFTADSDSFLFGSTLVFKDISLAEGHVVAYDVVKIKQLLGYGRNSLIALGILLGCDYFPGVHGIGPEKAQQFVKSIGDDKILEVMLREGPVTLARNFVKNKRDDDKENFSLRNKCDDDNVARQAIAAYSNPKCYSKTSQFLQRIMFGGTVAIEQLRRTCLQDFEWPFEKTDEYLLPKLAERDFHRSQSMDPAYKAGIQYKVSEIIKQRRLKGVDYYEVRWEGEPELPSSLIRAEDIQKAFPCKVEDFIASKDAKGRPKKSSKNKDDSSLSSAVEASIVASMRDLELSDSLLPSLAEKARACKSRPRKCTTSKTSPPVDCLLSTTAGASSSLQHEASNKAHKSQKLDEFTEDERNSCLDFASFSSFSDSSPGASRMQLLAAIDSPVLSSKASTPVDFIDLTTPAIKAKPSSCNPEPYTISSDDENATPDPKHREQLRELKSFIASLG